MPNVVTYYRVSTEEQALKDLSIAAQRKIVANYITDHGDHVFLKEFVDEGESGYAPAEKRPGFMAMMEFCKRNKVDLVLVYKFCRFSRFQEESVGYKAIIRRMGGRVRSVSEPTDPESAAGFLYEGMIEVINQFYSMNPVWIRPPIPSHRPPALHELLGVALA